MIHIREEDKFTQIYLITNCFEDSNKVYIGKEKSHKKSSRKANHKKFFGENIESDFIDKCFSWNKKDWKPLESFWINYFKFLGFEVLNKNDGGNGVEFHTKEACEKIRQAKLGSKHSEETKQKMRKPKPNGFIEFCKRPRSEKHKQNISKSLTGISRPNYKIPIVQFDLQGNPIKEWISQKDAGLELGINTINECLKGRQKTSGGFIWKYKNN